MWTENVVFKDRTFFSNLFGKCNSDASEEEDVLHRKDMNKGVIFPVVAC